MSILIFVIDRKMLGHLEPKNCKEFRRPLVDLLLTGRISSELMKIVAEAIVCLSLKSNYNEFRDEMLKDLSHPDHVKSFQYSFIMFSIYQGNKHFNVEVNAMIKSVCSGKCRNLPVTLGTIGHIGAREPFNFWDASLKSQSTSKQLVDKIVTYTATSAPQEGTISEKKSSGANPRSKIGKLDPAEWRDIRGSAIRCLVFMALQSPGHFTPFLTQNDLEFKGSLYEAFGDLCQLPEIGHHEDNLRNLFFWLMKEVETCSSDLEDGLFYTLGKMMSILPTGDLNLVLDKVKKSSTKRQDKFLLRASHNLFKPDEKLSPYRELIEWIIEKASSSDFEVVERALSAILSLNYYHRDSVMLQSLRQDQFLTVLAKHL